MFEDEEDDMSMALEAMDPGAATFDRPEDEDPRRRRDKNPALKLINGIGQGLVNASRV